jgi:uncharacterized protein (DUF1501 family)
MTGFSRRHLLGGLCALPSTLLLPRVLQAKGIGERKFLFIFATGGWDFTYCFAPMFDSDIVDTETNATVGKANGITFVDAMERPSVRSFFEDYGDQACIINGLECRSVAHDVCLRLMMTGSTLPGADDWPASLASRSAVERLLPMVNISGPSYTASLASEVVRVGTNGQFSALLDGSAFQDASDLAVVPPPLETDALEDAFVLARAQSAAGEAARGRALEILQSAATAEERMTQLGELADGLDLASGTNLVERSAILAECFEKGLSRCGMVEHDGFQGLGWDTHGANNVQGQNFEELFSGLSSIIRDLQGRPGEVASSLADEVTVVVISEMGRYPRLNSRGGKEHWTFTSAMLLGAGVAGGQVLGGYSGETFAGEPISLTSGEISTHGESLVPGHLGATLMTMADIDPAEFVSESPIEAAIR